MGAAAQRAAFKATELASSNVCAIMASGVGARVMCAAAQIEARSRLVSCLCCWATTARASRDASSSIKFAAATAGCTTAAVGRGMVTPPLTRNPEMLS